MADPEATSETAEVAPADDTSTAEVAAAEVAAPVVEESEDDLKTRIGDEAYAIVQDLRKEAGDTRTNLKKFKEAFEGFEEDGVSDFLAAVKAIREDPKTAAAQFKDLAEALADVAGTTVEEAKEVIEDALDDDAPLTKAQAREQFEAWQAEKAEKDEADGKAAEAKAELDATVRELGYDPESKDPEAQIAFTSLLKVASEQTNGDLAEADKFIKDLEQKKFDARLAEMQKTAEGVPPVADGSAPVETKDAPKSIAEAARRAKDRAKAAFGSDPTE